MAALQVRRIAYALGAEVSGVDLRQPLDDATIAEIRRVWLENQLLCFPGQDITMEQQLAFAKRFGDLETVGKENSHPENPNVSVLTEKGFNGKQWHGHKHGQNWHTDKSYSTRPTAGTFISCKQIPAVGGDTMFANTYMGYDSLSPGMQQLIEGLSAVHDSVLRRRYTGAQDVDPRTPEEIAQSAAARLIRNPPTVQPIARTHPETERKVLYLGDRARSIVGMTDEECRPLIDFLNAHAVAYEFTYRHRWTVNDLVMWDNRCTMHIALSDYNLGTDPRFMFRCAVMGEPSGYRYEAENAGAVEAPKTPEPALA